MGFASGGLHDEQRSEVAKGGVIDSQTWRIWDAGPDGFYIPQGAKGHSVELLLKVAEGNGFGGENSDE